jgi:hypothetical protein
MLCMWISPLAFYSATREKLLILSLSLQVNYSLRASHLITKTSCALSNELFRLCTSNFRIMPFLLEISWYGPILVNNVSLTIPLKYSKSNKTLLIHTNQAESYREPYVSYGNYLLYNLRRIKKDFIKRLKAF